MSIDGEVQSYPFIAPCGVYCRVCPSYGNTCRGCSSEDRCQKRISKWNCKIRKCCKEEHKIDFCCECNEYPCKTKLLKLRYSHPEDTRFRYRHNIVNNLEYLKTHGLQMLVEEQDAFWMCPKCGGIIMFYYNQCRDCGTIVGSSSV